MVLALVCRVAEALGVDVRPISDVASFCSILGEHQFNILNSVPREEVVRSLLLAIQARIERANADKDSNPVQCLAAASGVGKSHALVYLAKRFEHDGLLQDVGEGTKNFYLRFVPVTLTFNSLQDVSFDRTQMTPSQKLMARMIHSFFFAKVEYPKFVAAIPRDALADVVPFNVMSAIVAHCGRPVLLLIDEIVKASTNKDDVFTIMSQACSLMDVFNGSKPERMCHVMFSSLSPLDFKNNMTKSQRKVEWVQLNSLASAAPKLFREYQRLSTVQRIVLAACNGHPATIVEFSRMYATRKHNNLQEWLGSIRPRSFPAEALSTEIQLEAIKVLCRGHPLAYTDYLGTMTVSELIANGYFQVSVSSNESVVPCLSAIALFQLLQNRSLNQNAFCKHLKRILEQISFTSHGFETLVAEWLMVQLLVQEEDACTLVELLTHIKPPKMSPKTSCPEIKLMRNCFLEGLLSTNTSKVPPGGINLHPNTTTIFPCAEGQPGFDVLLVTTCQDQVQVVAIEAKWSRIRSSTKLGKAELERKLQLKNEELKVDSFKAACGCQNATIAEPLVVFAWRQTNQPTPESIILMDRELLAHWFTPTLCSVVELLVQGDVSSDHKRPCSDGDDDDDDDGDEPSQKWRSPRAQGPTPMAQ